MTLPPHEPAEAEARQRYIILNAVRFSGIALVMLGLAIARGLLPVPWVAGAVLAVAGLLEFFFLPPIIAKRWKAGDRKLK
jgi:hypothetical protein